jgi:hypothetical protein
VRTAAKTVRLRLRVAEQALMDAETTGSEWHDPQTIELAVVARLVVGLLMERVAELEHDTLPSALHAMTDAELRAGVNEFTEDDPPPYEEVVA